MKTKLATITLLLPAFLLAACGDNENVTKLAERIMALETKVAASGNSDALKKADERIKALEAKVAGDSALAGALAKAEARIKTLEAKTSTNPLKSAVDQAQARIKSLETQTAAMAKKMQGVAAETDATEKAVETQKATSAKRGSRMERLEKQAEAMSKDLAALKTAIDGRIDALGKDVAAAKKNADDSAAAAAETGKKLDSLSGEIKKMHAASAKAADLKTLTSEVDKAREELATMTRALSAINARISKLEQAKKPE